MAWKSLTVCLMIVTAGEATVDIGDYCSIEPEQTVIDCRSADIAAIGENDEIIVPENAKEIHITGGPPVPARFLKLFDQGLKVSDPSSDRELLVDFGTNDEEFSADCIAGRCFDTCGEPFYLNEHGTADNEAMATEIPTPGHVYAMQYDLKNLELNSHERIFILAQFVTASESVTLNELTEVRIFTREFYMDTRNTNFLFPSEPEPKCVVLMLTTGSGSSWYLVKQGTVVVIAEKVHYHNRCQLLPLEAVSDKSFFKVHVHDFVLEYLRAVTYCAQMRSQGPRHNHDWGAVLEMLDWVLTVLSWMDPVKGQGQYTQTMATRSEIVGLSEGYRYVPNLSNDVYSRILDLQYRLATTYHNEYKQFMNSKDDSSFRTTLYATMKVESEGLGTSTLEDFTQAEDALRTTKLAVGNLKIRFEEAKVKVDKALTIFEAGIDIYTFHESGRAAFGVFKAIRGILSGDPFKAWQSVEGLWNTFERLVKMIRTLDRVLKANSGMIKKVDGENIPIDQAQIYLEDLGKAAELPSTIVEWRNMVSAVEILLKEGDAAGIIGSRGYRRRLQELAEWGEALTRETIRQTDLLRRYLAKEAAMKARETYNQRVKTVFDRAELSGTVTNDLTEALALQMIDVKWMLTDTIHRFCQTYFYYHFQDCRPSLSPRLSDTLTDLLKKVDQIKIKGLERLAFLRRSQEMNEAVTIKDEVNCTACPIANFRESYSLIHTIDRNYRVFKYLDRVRLNETNVEIVGLRTTVPDEIVHVTIRTVGAFQDSYGGEIFNFTSSPVRLALIYNPTSNKVHMSGNIHQYTDSFHTDTSPFTTWIVELRKDINPELDLSGITEVNINLKVSGVPKYILI